jgi:gamma-glutamylcyclotransferase
MKYFAYGSNMLEVRFKHRSRAPSASCIGVGMLRGYQIRFHKMGKDGSAKCNALKTENLGDTVYGVVFHVADREMLLLDKEEDIGRGGYSRSKVNIEMVNGSREPLVACYFANPKFIDDSLHPFEWYKALVVAGAQEHNLPEEYVQVLREHPDIYDTDKGRTEKALDLLCPRYRHLLPSLLTSCFSRCS